MKIKGLATSMRRIRQVGLGHNCVTFFLCGATEAC
jgi:hypothetical protein